MTPIRILASAAVAAALIVTLGAAAAPHTLILRWNGTRWVRC